jgi:PAT family beta-lactamase induction signal transducer AmpG
LLITDKTVTKIYKINPMLEKLNAQLKNSITYRDFKALFQFRKNVENFDTPTGLTFSDNSFIRYLAFAALYFAQGIPGGLLHFAIPAWMATVDYSAMDVGKYLAIVTLPWSFKLIAAPIMDRFTFLPMGRRRPWLIAGQFGIVMGLILMSTIQDPSNNLTMLMSFGFVINLFTIFQDIATDGLAIDVLPEHQQARANGLMWGSKTVGVAAIVSVTIVLIKAVGFGSTLLLFSVLVFIIMIIPILVKERSVERRLPWTKGGIAEEVLNLQLPSWKLIFQKLVKVVFMPVSIMMGFAAFSFSIIAGILMAALPVFAVQELEWSDNQFPQILGSAKLIAGVLGMFIGGALIDIIGKIKMVSWLIVSMIALFVAFYFLSDSWQNDDIIYTFIISYHILDVFITIVIFAIAMQLCSKQVAATQFTLYMTVSNLGMSLGSYLFGHMEQVLQWKYIFLLNVIFLAIMFVFIRYIDFDKHKKKLDLKTI